jgi:hypothetical protein
MIVLKVWRRTPVILERSSCVHPLCSSRARRIRPGWRGGPLYTAWLSVTDSRYYEVVRNVKTYRTLSFTIKRGRISSTPTQHYRSPSTGWGSPMSDILERVAGRGRIPGACRCDRPSPGAGEMSQEFRGSRLSSVASEFGNWYHRVPPLSLRDRNRRPSLTE